MATAGPAWYTRIAASLLGAVIVLNGCAGRAIIFPEQNQSPAQVARDQTECMAEAKESAGYAGLAGEGIRTTLAGSVVGAIAGAALGALAGLQGATGQQDPGTAGLIIAGGVGVGAVIGWFVGTGLGVKASAREVQELVGQAFQRCMENRGYKVGRERR